MKNFALVFGILLATFSNTVLAESAGPYGYCPHPVVYLNASNQLAFGLAPSSQATGCTNSATNNSAVSGSALWVFGSPPIPTGQQYEYAFLPIPSQTLTLKSGSGGVSNPPLLSSQPSSLCPSDRYSNVQLLNATNLQYNQTYHVRAPALGLYAVLVMRMTPFGVGPAPANVSNNCAPTLVAFTTPKAPVSAMSFFGGPIGSSGDFSLFFSYNTAQDAQMSLAWHGPAATPATGVYAAYQSNPTYTVSIVPNNNTGLAKPQVGVISGAMAYPNARSCNITGLQPSTSYTLTITATDPNANNIPALTGTFTSPAATLSFNNNVSIRNIKQHSATVSWLAATGDYPSNIHYSVTIKSGNTVVKTISVDNVAPVTVTGLQPNTPYDVTVSATDALANNSPLSHTTSFTTKTTLSAIKNISLVNNTYKQATLSWDPVTGDVANRVTYHVAITAPANTAAVVTQPGHNTSAVVANVTPNTTYAFTVTANDDNAINAPSAKASFSTSKATLSNFSTISFEQSTSYQQGTLSWSALTGDHAKNITYQATISPSTHHESVTVNANNTATLNNLRANHSYTVQLTATDANATNSPTISKNITAEKATLTPLSKLAVTGITTQSAAVSWNPAQGDTNADISYAVSVSSTAGVVVPSKNIIVQKNSASISGLTVDTQYNVTVTAQDADATKSVSAQKTFATAKAILSFPNTISISRVTKNSAQAAWSAAIVTAGNASDIKYNVTISPNNNGETAALNAGNTSAALSNLQPDAQYTINVTATDAHASNAPMITKSMQTLPTTLIAPYNLTDTRVTTDSVHLAWNTATGDVASEIKYAVQITPSANAVVSNLTNSSADITGLSPKTRYTASVVATDARANPKSVSSASISFSTNPVVLTSPVITIPNNGVNSNSAMISWQNAGGDNNSYIQYKTAITPAGTITPISMVGRYRPDNTVSITELQPDTSYSFSVTASDARASKPVVVYKTFTTLLATLTAPDVTITRITRNSAIATWTAATGDNAADITYAKSISPQATIQPLLGNSMGVSLINLEPNTHYTLTVTANDKRAVQPASANSAFTTLAIPKPVLPKYKTLTKPVIKINAASATCAEIYWPSVSGDAATNISYDVTGAANVGMTPANGNFVQLIYNLTPNTRYPITVTAHDIHAVDGGAASVIEVATQPSPFLNIKLAMQTATTAMVTWTSSMSTIASPRITYEAKITAQSAVARPASAVVSGDRVLLENLMPGAKYQVIIYAIPAGFPENYCTVNWQQIFVVPGHTLPRSNSSLQLQHGDIVDGELKP